MSEISTTKYSPGPWSSCHNGECRCKKIWSTTAHHPVAEIIAGEWGDDYPSIRLVGNSLELKAEAYIDQITYGKVSEECAIANARLIAAAPELLEALEEVVELAHNFINIPDGVFALISKAKGHMEV